jgi:hypothetical protein
LSDDAAINALVLYGNVPEARATALVRAWADVAAAEALLITSGELTVAGSQRDQRVETVARLTQQLVEQAEDEDAQRQVDEDVSSASGHPLTEYELASLWRITPTAARGVLSTWRARYPKQYHEQMVTLVKSGDKTPGGDEDNPTYVFAFEHAGVYEYALERLRRAGLHKGLTPTRSALKIEVPQSTKADGQDAAAILGIE